MFDAASSNDIALVIGSFGLYFTRVLGAGRLGADNRWLPTLPMATVVGFHRSTGGNLSRPLPLPLPSTASREARRAGAAYRLGVQELTVAATERDDRPITRLDAGLSARNLPSSGEST